MGHGKACQLSWSAAGHGLCKARGVGNRHTATWQLVEGFLGEQAALSMMLSTQRHGSACCQRWWSQACTDGCPGCCSACLRQHHRAVVLGRERKCVCFMPSTLRRPTRHSKSTEAPDLPYRRAGAARRGPATAAPQPAHPALPGSAGSTSPPAASAGCGAGQRRRSGRAGAGGAARGRLGARCITQGCPQRALSLAASAGCKPAECGLQIKPTDPAQKRLRSAAWLRRQAERRPAEQAVCRQLEAGQTHA